MANPEHLAIIQKGVSVWNKWREENQGVKPDLCDAMLEWVKLERINLEEANLSGANLSEANLSEADLSWANLGKANLGLANLAYAILYEANLSGANIEAGNLLMANFQRANLEGANLSNALVGRTIFADINFSNIKGLETINHINPSEISISTLYKSKGNIPDIFLRGCGVPDNFSDYVHSLTGKAFDFYSCFISHSSVDKIFVERLYADLQANGVRCWYAPEDLKGGEHLDYQIDRAIRTHEKLLLILSESSMKSNWVRKEIKKAIKQEAQTGKRVLFPISLVEFSVIENWEFSDSTGLDLAEEIRKFYIPSFRGWGKDNDLYKKEFDRLLASFKQEKDE